MPHQPLISIVTPSFNQGKFLERTIASVLDQNYPRVEYIVIDGKSTDNSLDIITKYSHRIAYWCSESDQGQTDAIQKGLKIARGDILAYLNSDDVLRPGALALVAENLRIDKPQWLVGNQQIIDDLDNVICRRPIFPFSLSDIWYNNYLIPQECTFFNRSILDAIGGFDSSFTYAMDMHAWLRMASLAHPVLLRDYLGCFRVHPAQKTSRMDNYFAEVHLAKELASQWREALGLVRTPPKPLIKGRLHKAAKALYYLAVGGPAMLRDILHFQQTYRNLLDPLKEDS